ncbi:Uncharacterised protein [Candidatus Bilamarchaeum dharawalense]|uniref:Uncharacterized protein n=1 Tax=Candidatus Bilamarchaeum dharawalense TaxID=2885759 RepID=A0A5E4LTP1_9ARCH|nr:Uncharacterised protein [Candidatus Bilamarchaeum dharawalense]
MVGGIKGIARRPFNGDKRIGSRHAYLLDQLTKRGCKPKVDRYNNIWVVKGSGTPFRLFSSHYDVDPRIRQLVFRYQNDGNRRIMLGVLDNAVGCYINMLLAQKGPKKGRAIYIFTASEEIKRNHPRMFARSAREIVKQLKKRKIHPDYCVTVDVTYPKLLHPQENLNWDQSYEKLFDVNDTTHCYVDGFSRPVSRRLGVEVVKRFKSPKVAVRDFHGHDEAIVYDHLCPSFAFGPVVYGHFDKPEQMMPLAHLQTALRFLRRL